MGIATPYMFSNHTKTSSHEISVEVKCTSLDMFHRQGRSVTAVLFVCNPQPRQGFEYNTIIAIILGVTAKHKTLWGTYASCAMILSSEHDTDG